jgi:hypothetical protein
MAAVAARHGCGQVLVEVNEARAGDMGFAVCAASRPGISEIVPAVAHDPAGVIEMRGEIG